MPRTLATFLLSTVLGLPLGIYLVQHKFIDKEKAFGMVSEEAVADDFAKKEFIYADTQSARTALAYAIKLHKDVQSTNALSGWPEKSDLGWCYAELSLVEESAGNTILARDYMTQAEQTLQGIGLKDASEAHIRELLRRNLAPKPPSIGASK